MKTLTAKEADFHSGCLFDDIINELFQVGLPLKYEITEDDYSTKDDPSYVFLLGNVDANWMNFAEYHYASMEQFESDFKLLTEYIEVDLIKNHK